MGKKGLLPLMPYYLFLVEESKTWKDFNKYCIEHAEELRDDEPIFIFYDTIKHLQPNIGLQDIPQKIKRYAKSILKGDYLSIPIFLSMLSSYFNIPTPTFNWIDKKRPKEKKHHLQAYLDYPDHIYIYVYLPNGEVIPPFSVMENLLHEWQHYCDTIAGIKSIHTFDFYKRIGALREVLGI